ncbi:MAG TPA: NAD(P)-dependent oxidoreductase [Cytophaga sp.]|jgi:saccharopine dehydrogenase (NAD+, L-lysine-forming)|nr:NAD(P)-dependent oxidoreductase [Cytophaga sp.]
MTKLKIGIIREGKVPSDRRVPLLPYQCVEIMQKYPHVEIYVQPSDVRCVANKEYVAAGIPLREDLSDCTILMGIKEVPIHELISDKTYLFFSHTIKMQPHNQKLLQTILEKRITMIDYEALRDVRDKRVIAFGYFAGIVGAYNTFLLLGRKYNLFKLKPAYRCFDIDELKRELKNITIPAFKIVLTGAGRVGFGAELILKEMNIEKVSPQDFLIKTYKHPVYTQIVSSDYNQSNDKGAVWDTEDFHKHPENYHSTFMRFAKAADVLIAGAYWDQRAPKLFTTEESRQKDFSIRLISDITCDINGSIPVTVKSTNIYDPAYDFNSHTKDIEAPFSDPRNITVMAIDNLPCEVPRSASEDFGKQLIKNVLPDLLKQPYGDLIARCALTVKGKLGPCFDYLKAYSEGK